MKIFYILCFILLTIGGVKGQVRANLPDNPTQKSLRYYPNPAISQITFSFEQGFDRSHSLQIYNFIGKKVFELPSINSKTVVDLSNYYRGVYIFQVRDKIGKIAHSGTFQIAK